MGTTTITLRRIEAAAVRLDERIAARGYAPVPTPDEEIDRRIAAWTEAVGSSAALERRLAWSGLDRAAARRLVADHVPTGPAPGWVGALADVVAETSAARAGGTLGRSDGPAASGRALEFEDVLRPAVRVGRRRLVERLAGRGLPRADLLADSRALADLERALLVDLAERAGRALAAELAREPALDPDRRARFVDRVSADGLLGFFAAYPALGRLVGEAVLAWVDNQADFLARLEADRPAIEARFGRTTGRIVALAMGLSDPHDGLGRVQGVRFESGLTLVYKPKSVAAEAAYDEFLAACRRAGAPVPLRAPAVLARSDYGWVEWVEPAELGRAADAGRFFENAGALACILYALRATDGHVENVIAAGTDLVLVDAETLLHADPRPMGGPAALPDVVSTYLSSVLRSGLLPHWSFDSTGQGYDYSGLGAGRAANAAARHAGSGRMTYEPDELDVPAHRNAARFGGRPVDPQAHLEAILSGFERTYDFCLAARDGWLAPGGALELFAGLTQRYVFRETRIYGALLRRSYGAGCLTDGLARSFEIERLGRAFLYDEKPFNWGLADAERACLERGDVPRFGTPVGETAVTAGVASPVADAVERPAFEAVRRHLAGLGAEDRRRQRDLVEACFHAAGLRTIGAEPLHRALPEVDLAALEDRPPLDRDECRAIGLALAERIARRAIVGRDGSAGWIVPVAQGESGKFNLEPMAPGLYGGTYGPALVLAAADALTGSDLARPIVGALLSPLRGGDPVAAALALHAGPGLGAGLGSLVQSLLALGRFLDEPAHLELAVRLLAGATPAAVGADEVCDVVGGAAGLALAAAALFRETGDARILPAATLLGDHLLARRTPDRTGFAAWRTLGHVERPLTGFSHGAAGIALALLRLASMTGREDYRDAAREAIAFERAVFDPALRNWPDFRDAHPASGGPRAMTSWCHGSTGIGLGRAASIEHLPEDGAALAGEVRQAIASSPIELDRLAVDHVCCGNLGRVELRLEAGRRLGEPALVEDAYRQVARLAARARQTDGFLVYRGMPGRVFDPKFFQGAGGIAYQFLRLADPERLPSVLLFE